MGHFDHSYGTERKRKSPAEESAVACRWTAKHYREITFFDRDKATSECFTRCLCLSVRRPLNLACSFLSQDSLFAHFCHEKWRVEWEERERESAHSDSANLSPTLLHRVAQKWFSYPTLTVGAKCRTYRVPSKYRSYVTTPLSEMFQY